MANSGSPFAPKYKEEDEGELAVAEKRVDTALSIIHKYDEAITEFMKTCPDAKRLKGLISKKIPHLQTVLHVIAESVGTNSVASQDWTPRV